MTPVITLLGFKREPDPYNPIAATFSVAIEDVAIIRDCWLIVEPGGFAVAMSFAADATLGEAVRKAVLGAAKREWWRS